MSILSQIRCSPLDESEAPVSDEEVAVLHTLVPTWRMVTENGHRKLRNRFTFDDERLARQFVERLEAISVKESHPIELDQRGETVEVTAWTPAIGGVHPNDFLLAGKADGAFTFVIVGHPGDMFTDEPLPKLWDLPLFRPLASRRFGKEKARLAG